MDPYYLDKLTERYSRYDSGDIDPMDRLVKKYRQYKNTSILDLTVVAVSLSSLYASREDLDPLALKAIQDTNPNFDPDKLFGYSDAQMVGMINSAKGKYFEYLVVDKLNKGESVGDVILPPGYSAELADSMSQPGWDLKIIDESGQVSEYLQLKSTDSLSYISETLDRYPDITILATSEVAGTMDETTMVLDAGMTDEKLESVMGETFDSYPGLLDHVWDVFAPLSPLILIASMQGYQVLVKKQLMSEAIEVAKARSIRAIVAGGTGLLLKSMGADLWVSVPSAILAGLYIDNIFNIKNLISSAKKQNEKLAAQMQFQSALLLQ